MRSQHAAQHGVVDADIHHAVANALGVVELEHDGEERLLVIAPLATASYWS